jgi:polysaccharide biosynthesis transport protein
MTTLTAIYMARKPDIYRAAAVVQVDLEQNNPDLITSDRQRPVSTTDPSYFNTQLQLLTSESLLRRAVKEHNLDADKNLQQARNDSGSSTFRTILRSIGLASGGRSDKPSEGDQSSDSGLASAEEIAEAVRLSPYVDLIKKNLEIEPRRESRATVKDTRLIDISFYSSSPELAASVVNGLAETFTTNNQEKRSGTSSKTNDFLQERIAGLQSDIKADEEQLQSLNQDIGIIKTEGDQTIVIERLSGLNKQLLEAENDRKNAEANYITVSNSPETREDQGAVRRGGPPLHNGTGE